VLAHRIEDPPDPRADVDVDADSCIHYAAGRPSLRQQPKLALNLLLHEPAKLLGEAPDLPSTTRHTWATRHCGASA
jgi:hypothetical protein